ncbi:hypothetical protein B0H67DRAFT_613675 [Lasiosphaeris hirsuta]|uniref:DUF2293 domain-containing protein n=1 Tax=Lasiosphaeris hirsuta TaxID=260670 RepID=A0AA39ZX18_9PEZI|nr:hypothetical protein B0H67DRAFT_613675 [Lasiosphaeris hirsuta]
MGREKRGGVVVPAGGHAKDRHKRDRKGNIIDWTAPLPPGLVARPDRPQPNSKHKSYFEFIENKDKKKKLELQFTSDRRPPPGFEFVPIGNPALTTACKELSREQEAMIFIVTAARNRGSRQLTFQMNRVGHHIRQSIVEQARESLGDDQHAVFGISGANPGSPEPIPERQEDIDRQADAAIRDLFPRIPNTDRQRIIEHAFNKSKLKNGREPPVGLAPDQPLSRRVQLAVLAHIRHTHTRYDQLLNETTWAHARKAVEPLCLDILVKWRGDEETGRDQLDEILCEVVVISDSESDDDDEDEDEDEEGECSDTSVPEDAMDQETIPSGPLVPLTPSKTTRSRGEGRPRGSRHRMPNWQARREAKKDEKAKKAQRGFSRYKAARDRAWEHALERQRLGNNEPAHTVTYLDGPTGRSTQPWRPTEPGHAPHLSYGNSYHSPKDNRADDHLVSNGFGPIVGSQSAVQVNSGVDGVGYHNRDPNDHLVPSIEPYSPSRPRPLMPVKYHGHFERGSFHGPRASVEAASHYHRRATPYGEVSPAMGHHATREQEDFVTLPPRQEIVRMPTASDQHRGSLVAVSTQHHGMVRAYTPMDTTGSVSTYQPLLYGDNAANHQSGRILSSESRPIWINDDDVVVRPEYQPVLDENHLQSRQPAFPADNVFPDHHPLEVKREPTIAFRSSTAYAQPHDPRQEGAGVSYHHPVESRYGEFEIVRVSNKFPRRHEPAQAFPVDTGGYEIRPPALQSYEPHHGSVDARRYGVRSEPQYQRIERVIGRVEEPVYTGGYPIHPQRQERVVGIEYVSAPEFRETRTYTDQPLVSPYGGRDHVLYGSQPSSVAPGPYSDANYRQQFTGNPSQRDRIIIID